MKRTDAKRDVLSEQISDESYGSKVRDLRIRNGLTQNNVAESLGVTPGYISNIENNRTAMSLRVLIYYAKLTGMSLDALVGDLEDDYSSTALDNLLHDRISKLAEEDKRKLLAVINILF